jgi:hypothetical protein
MKKVILGGIAAGVVILVVTLAVSYLIQLIWPYDVLSLGGMRSSTDPLMALFFLYPFVLGLAIAHVYPHITLDGKKKGCKFGLMMWSVFGLPSLFVIVTSMNYPAGFYISNLVGNLIGMALAGAVIEKIAK